MQQRGELRHDGKAVAGHALAGLAAMDDALDAVAVGAEGEERALVRQAGQVEVEVGTFVDQFHIEAIRLTDGRTWRQMTPSAFDLF